MDQGIIVSKKEPTTLDSLLDGAIPPIVEEIRNWAEEEEVGPEWREKRQEKRR